MDESSIIIGSGLVASKDLITKVLGPTADYIGGEIEHLVEKVNENLSVIFRNAARKLGEKLNEPGAVNPRVLQQVWQEGCFCEDALAAEYFGGLLAAARSPDGKDDRGVNLIATARALSVFDLRLHYLIYSLVRSLFASRPYRISLQEDRVALSLFVPFRVYMKAMRLEDETAAQDLAAHSLIALTKHELVDHRFAMGPLEVMRKHCKVAESPGMFLIPSFFGAELFLWAHGYSDRRIDQFLEPGLPFEPCDHVQIIEGARPARMADI